MALSATQLARLLSSLGLVVLIAHLCGQAFARFRQPRVVGEIVGGILLGPTALGLLAPGVQRGLFPATGPVAVGQAAFNQLGLLLLMFLAGAHLRAHAKPAERRIAASVAAFGLVVPFAAGVVAIWLLGHQAYAGPHGTRPALMLTFGIAAAVAAIPIISRIMMDLGIIGTPFARIVLIVAVAEDVLLYLVLAAVLGLAKAEADGARAGGLALDIARYLLVCLAFFAVCGWWGPRFVRWLADRRWNYLERSSPTAFRLVLLFLAVGVGSALGINPIFAALLAGYSAARGDALADPDREAETLPAWDALGRIGHDFLIPVYFGFVGIQLDLVHQFDPLFFALFTVAVCTVKGLSTWTGARLVKAGPRAATRIAVALNARGTPGVTLATVTYAAGVINMKFFATLVMMSIVTCQIAGFWLDRSIRRHPGEELLPAGVTGPEETARPAGRASATEEIR
jgi:Kef-type K+ transport system membrane component KefB